MSLNDIPDITYPDAIDALGLKGKALTPESVKTAYRIRAQETHPDKPGGSAEKFQRVKDAYELLKDVSPTGRFGDKYSADVDWSNMFAGFEGLFGGRKPSASSLTEVQKAENRGVDIALEYLRRVASPSNTELIRLVSEYGNGKGLKTSQLLEALIIEITNRKHK
jgi:curved DNA-binding protein CbpA